MKAYIGVDLGGTNVRVAKVDENGTILQMVKEATEIEQGVEHVVAKIISMIERIDRYADCEGIGMSSRTGGYGSGENGFSNKFTGL